MHDPQRHHGLPLEQAGADCLDELREERERRIAQEEADKVASEAAAAEAAAKEQQEWLEAIAEGAAKAQAHSEEWKAKRKITNLN